MYHHVNPNTGDQFTVTPEVFEEQMAYLVQAGFKALSLDELYAFIKGELVLRQKAVVITLDDGWLDNYIYAFPVLQKYNLRATIFTVTDCVEKASAKFDVIPVTIPTHEQSKALILKGEEQHVVLTWQLIREMAESGLIDVYSHSKSHAHCDVLSETDILTELTESRNILEQRLGRPCPYFCWPYGSFNDTAVYIARKTGYKALFTIERGAVKTGTDPFAINRILAEDTISAFKKSMRIYSNPFLYLLYLSMHKIKMKLVNKWM
jgi:peptidoglycan/xylan/chitin deacetylase (PgdA/CDA1 family)